MSICFLAERAKKTSTYLYNLTGVEIVVPIERLVNHTPEMKHIHFFFQYTEIKQ